MQRAAAIALIADVINPLDPYRTYGEVLEARDRAIEHAAFDDVQGLLDLLLQPPTSIDPDGRDAWDAALVDAIATWGRRDPGEILAMLKPLTSNTSVRPAVISIVGLLRDPAGLGVLRSFVDRAAELTPVEQALLASALGSIGGNDARQLLQQLSSKADAREPDVTTAIALAQKAVGLPSESRRRLYPSDRELHETLSGNG